jgi:hypothetical protein
MLATPYMVPKMPVNIGRLSSGAEWEIMISAPEKMPAHPTPAIARPTMRAVEVGATPQIRDPSSNIKMAVI